MLVPLRVYERLLRWADRDHETGCLVSRYSTGSHGYAQIGWVEAGVRTVTTAHLALWVYVEGEPAPGMTVDHTCKNKRCVERSHLRLLSNYDNARRTRGRDWPLGQCIRGHSDSHLHQQPNGRTRCTKCKAEYQREYRARRKERARSRPSSSANKREVGT